MNYTYVIERSAAQTVFGLSSRERRFVQAVIEDLVAAPFRSADLDEAGDDGRHLLTRFFGPFSVTYWLDHATKEVRIVAIYRD